MPWRQESRLREAIGHVAPFVGARPDDLVFVPNVTTGVNAVLRSVPLSPGDEVVISELAYGGVALAAQAVARDRGAILRTIEMPAPLRDAGDVVDAFVRAITPRTKLVLVDHITAQSALVLPVAAIAAECHARGVPVLVDGAHAPGSCSHILQPALTGTPATCTSGRTRLDRAASCGRSPSIKARFVTPSCPGDRVTDFMRNSSTRPPSIRRAISPLRKGSRFCVSGISTRSSVTCTGSLWKRAPPLRGNGERRSTRRAT